MQTHFFAFMIISLIVAKTMGSFPVVDLGIVVAVVVFVAIRNAAKSRHPKAMGDVSTLD